MKVSHMEHQSPITCEMLARLRDNMILAEAVSARVYRAERAEATDEECRDAFVSSLVKGMFRE